MNNDKSGFVSMALVYTFLVIFLFLMVAILRTYIEKNKYLEAINSQIDIDINKDKNNRSFILGKILEDNLPRSYEQINFVLPSNRKYGNGNGLFYMINDKTDENGDGNVSRMYFFRGSVDNNYLVFADMCFRIIRTNDDGSIRMAYIGDSDREGCISNANINESKFSVYQTVSLVDVVDNRIPTYDESNIQSEVFSILNNWYKEKIINTDISNDKNNASKISGNAIFCNNKEISSSNNSITYYKAKEMMPIYKDNSNINKFDVNNVTNNFSLVCLNDTDRFSYIDRTIKYPVGLLSAEDLLLAGAYLTDSDDNFTGGRDGMENKDFYLYFNKTYWTSSALKKVDNHYYMVALNENGVMQGLNVLDSAGVIPVISLNADVKVGSGDGSALNPYKVK